MRYLGLDLGTKTLGLSLSDVTGTIASTYKVIRFNENDFDILLPQIKEIVLKILEENPKSIEDYKAGKDRALGFLVGQSMKQTKGKANPKMLNEMFLEELKK